MKKGKVYLVGAGPGDPGLLTLRGKELLAQADAVVYDALVHPRILEMVSDKAQKIFRGHRSQKTALSQSRINRLLIRLSQNGKLTIRLKGGDPFVFGRGAEEILALEKEHIPFEVVPGVSSAIAVPAYAGIPVTHRNLSSSLTIVTGHESSSKNSSRMDWKNLAENNGTLVFLMGLHTLKRVCEKLVRGGKSEKTPAAVIQRGTMSGQKTVVGTLETIFQRVQKAKLSAPAVLVVGDVVGLRSKVYWLSHRPLFGIRILLTRTREQSSHLAKLLSDAGAEVVEIPTIEIHPLPLDSRARERIKHISNYDWIVLTSPNAVDILMNDLKQLKKSYLDMTGKTACVGASTAHRLSNFGLKADLVPSDYKQEGLVKAFQKISVKDKKILIPCAQKGRDLLSRFLRQKGAHVDVWPIYENKVPVETPESLLRLFKKEGGVDLVVFASSSSADHFYGALTPPQRHRWVKQVPVAVIGPITAASVRKWGAGVVVEPHRYTMSDLVHGIRRWAKANKPLKY